MTRAELRTLMRSWLDDTNGGYFTDANCNTWLNLAQRRIQMDLLQAGQNWYETVAETTTVASQADYLFPSDFVVEHRIEIVMSGAGPTESRQMLSPITTNQQTFVSIALGAPTNYFIKKDRFTVSPTPDKAYLLRLYYSPMVADLGSDSTTPDVPEQLIEYVALLAAFDGFIKDDRAPTNLMAKKEEYKQILKQMANTRTADVPRQIVTVTDYDNMGAIP